MDIKWFEEMEARIPRSGVRTRFAPSPTGYMHVGNLRTALYTWLIARKNGGSFILRIEDTDQSRLVEGAQELIYKTLAECGLTHDEGPDIGGPAGPYIQTQRREIYGRYAEYLLEKGGAYRCFCEKGAESADAFSKQKCPCSYLSAEESKKRADAKESFVIRQRVPITGQTSFVDEVFGEICVPNDTLDDNVLMKSDSLPTYNFANVVDDHLMGITHVVRGSEYLASTPKYNLLYDSFGWDKPTYIHCSPVMRDAQHKMSKRHGDPSYEDLIEQGYLTQAVVNYVALLGWSPGGEREIYTLNELSEVFDVGGISKSPAIFDIAKLKYFNSEYIKALTPEKFLELAEPFMRQSVRNPEIDLMALVPLLQPRTELLTDIPPKIDFFETLPDYSIELFVNKKSKTDAAVSLKMLEAAKKVLEGLKDWTDEAIHGALVGLAEALAVKNATLMWPVRIAVSGKAVTPGGAVELCRILGRQECLRRLAFALEKLKAQ
jgi:glutamyl-tRNA synthetase